MASLANTIKYEGDNSTFVWKHPCEDFNTNSQLIVHESQEAIFFMNGMALDLFGPGRHSLQTENIPLIRKLMNLPYGGISPFHCEVYFINKAVQMAIRWGTDSKIQYIEPTYKFPLSIGACGEMSVTVSDSRRLLLKLVGTEKIFNQQTLGLYFKGILMTKVKSYLAQTIREKNVNIFEIDENLESFSNVIWKLLVPVFQEYGIDLKHFLITTILKPESDPIYIKFKELYFRQYADIAEAKIKQQTNLIDAQTNASRMIIESQAQATKRKQEGYTYQEERGYDVAGKAATNQSIGQFTNIGLGLGMMTGIGKPIGNMIGEAMEKSISINKSSEKSRFKYCDQCGAKIDIEAEYCDQCGSRQTFDEICKNCGYHFVKPGKFCPKCGAKRT